MDLVWDQEGVLMPNEEAVRGPLPREFEPLLNLEEAASVLGMHWKTLERMARDRKVPAFKVGKRWKFRLTSLNAWLEDGLNSTTTDYAVLTGEEQHP
jgi:excisionase family DNA binding protein